jgi:hypothetical protein
MVEADVKTGQYQSSLARLARDKKHELKRSLIMDCGTDIKLLLVANKADAMIGVDHSQPLGTFGPVRLTGA